MSRLAFIIGGTGQIGRACARQLLADGWTVTVGSRSDLPADMAKAGVRHARLDRSADDSLQQALGAGADLLIDCIAYDERDSDQLLYVARSVGAIVAISSAGVYRDDAGRALGEAPERGFPDLPVPITETQAVVAPGPASYASRKVAMEARLLARASVPVAIFRPCAIYGEHSSAPREWFFVKRLLDGRRAVPIAYDAASRFHTVSVENIAALVAAWAAKPATAVLNAVDPDAPTVREIGRAIAGALGFDLEIVGLPDDGYPPRAGASPWSVPRPFVLSDRAARGTGYEPVGGYADLVAPVVRWLAEAVRGRDWREVFPGLAAYPFELFAYDVEDKLIQR